MNQLSYFPVYIADTGIITAIGEKTDQVYAAARAGISGYKAASYFTKDRQNMMLASVPDGALPALSDRLNLSGKRSFRDKRLLRMSLVAAIDAMKSYTETDPVPLIFSAPENYSGFDNSLNGQFITDLCEQSGLAIDIDNSRLIHTGRPGVIDALKLATHYLYDEGFNHVLIGGADSCQHSEYLAFLDADSRIRAQRINPTQAEDSFFPGEGAAFLLLTRHPAQALKTAKHRIRLDAPGFGHESGHLYSEQPYRAEGLDQAVKQALANRQTPEQPVHLVYSSMNGENHWTKEFGVALTRNSEHFSEQLIIEHPAENYGDIGAATGAGLILMAHSRLLLDKPGCCLVCSSADQQSRAAICLTTESIAA